MSPRALISAKCEFSKCRFILNFEKIVKACTSNIVPNHRELFIKKKKTLGHKFHKKQGGSLSAFSCLQLRSHFGDVVINRRFRVQVFGEMGLEWMRVTARGTYALGRPFPTATSPLGRAGGRCIPRRGKSGQLHNCATIVEVAQMRSVWTPLF